MPPTLSDSQRRFTGWIHSGDAPCVTSAVVTLVWLVSCLMFSSGCKRQGTTVVQKKITVAPTRNETSPYEVAIRFLNSLDQYQPEQVRVQIVNSLREWARQERDDVDWIADPMFRRLPSDLKDVYTTDRLATNEFNQFDGLVLQEAIWLRDVAKSVAAQSLYEPHVIAWLSNAVRDDKLSEQQADDLALAYRLFDWTIRNIQLDPEIEARDFLGGDASTAADTSVRHLYSPWENLLFGHGDWLERSRVFILLARQVGINVVMLIADRGEEARQVWLPAVVAGEQLFLFDPLLGIPLPGPDGAVVGRLSDYVESPELLDELTALGAYRIGPSDLENLLAAIDATPSALSQRMKQVEARLTGDRKMVLTVAPTPLGRLLRENKHITNVEIWTLPYRGYEFLSRVQSDPNQASPELLAAKQQEQLPFDTRSSIMQGRLLHLRGVYRGDANKPGATRHYMAARMSNKQLATFSLPMDRVPEDSPMLLNLPADPVRKRLMFEQRMRTARDLAIWSKDLATHWLGQAAFEKHEFKVAADYFRRVVAATPTSRFRQNAAYNLARSLEAIGIRDNRAEALSEASRWYDEVKDSTQGAGNRYRALRLETLVKP